MSDAKMLDPRGGAESRLPTSSCRLGWRCLCVKEHHFQEEAGLPRNLDMHKTYGTRSGPDSEAGGFSLHPWKRQTLKTAEALVAITHEA